MEEIINIPKYKNDINGFKQIIKTCLLSNCITVRQLKNDNLHMIIINKLKNIFSSLNQQIVLNNNFTRHILIFGDIPDYWDYDIVIYIKFSHELYFPYYFDNLLENLKLQEITILEKNKNYLKFVLNICDKNFTFIVKEKNILCDHRSYFEINQLEYDIKNDLLINSLTNQTYLIDGVHIANIKKLDLFCDLNIDSENKYNYILEHTQINPFIIFELIELLVNFPTFFNVIEVNNFLLNLNGLLETQNNFVKSIKKISDNDEELIFYKKLIKFAHYLEENGLYTMYIKYLIYEHKPLITVITGVKIDEKLFNLFDNLCIRDIICLLIFQHLIYKKRGIFKKIKKNNRRNMDLMEIFMDGGNCKDNDNDSDNNNDNNSNDSANKKIDFNINEFNLLDKYKFKSLKYLKETAKNFIKFESLIKMVPINLKDQIQIKQFYNINMLLYTELKDTKKHHALKLAYIIKRFHLVPKELLEKIILLFNHVIINKKYENYFLIQNNFINIITSKVLNDWIFKKMTFIPEIKKKFDNDMDCIDIIDYQDTFILFIEFIYKNKHNYFETEDEITEWFDSVFEAGICDMRSYRIFKNEVRRKKEKKARRAKKEKKEQHKSKYKIIKKNVLNNLKEDDESNDANNKDNEITQSSDANGNSIDDDNDNSIDDANSESIDDVNIDNDDLIKVNYNSNMNNNENIEHYFIK